jgi:diacylglycerol kinase
MISEKAAKEDLLKEGGGASNFFVWLKGRAQSFVHAGRGFFLLCLSQWNFRIHLVAALGATCLGWYFRISAIEWLVLVVTITLVLTAEALNTALERTVDIVKASRHPIARDAKDLAAAGVLIASFGSLAVALIMFGPRLLRLFIG